MDGSWRTGALRRVGLLAVGGAAAGLLVAGAMGSGRGRDPARIGRLLERGSTSRPIISFVEDFPPDDIYRNAADRSLAGLSRAYGSAGWRVDVLRDLDREELIACARSTDVLVVGSHGNRRLVDTDSLQAFPCEPFLRMTRSPDSDDVVCSELWMRVKFWRYNVYASQIERALAGGPGPRLTLLIGCYTGADDTFARVFGGSLVGSRGLSNLGAVFKGGFAGRYLLAYLGAQAPHPGRGDESWHRQAREAFVRALAGAPASNRMRRSDGCDPQADLRCRVAGFPRLFLGPRRQAGGRPPIPSEFVPPPARASSMAIAASMPGDALVTSAAFPPSGASTAPMLPDRP